MTEEVLIVCWETRTSKFIALLPVHSYVYLTQAKEQSTCRIEINATSFQRCTAFSTIFRLLCKHLHSAARQVLRVQAAALPNILSSRQTYSSTFSNFTKTEKWLPSFRAKSPSCKSSGHCLSERCTIAKKNMNKCKRMNVFTPNPHAKITSYNTTRVQCQC